MISNSLQVVNVNAFSARTKTLMLSVGVIVSSGPIARNCAGWPQTFEYHIQ